MIDENGLINEEEQIATNGLSSLTSLIDSGRIIDSIVQFGVKLFLAIIIFVVGWQLIRVIKSFAKKAMAKGNLSPSTCKLLMNFISAVLYVLLIFIVAEQLGIPSATIIALLGSVGIAIGLSLQGSLSNVAGGLLILLMRPFSIGDYISGCDIEGTVQNIGMVYTTILTPDNRKITIPNSTISNSTVTNITSEGKRRVEVVVPISYLDDITSAKDIMIKVFRGSDKILQDEEVYAFVKELDGSAVQIGGRGWADTTTYWQALWEIQEKVKLAFDDAGLHIPYQQVDDHLHGDTAADPQGKTEGEKAAS